MALWAAEDVNTTSPSRHAKYVRSLLEMRQEGVVIQKWDLSCGAAALATILAHQHNDPVPEREIAKAMLRETDPSRVQARLGFSLLDLKRFAVGRGYIAKGYGQLTIDDLLKFAPIIVPVQFTGYNHFVVFRGMHAGRVLLADPAFGNRTMPLAKFEEAWQGNLGFVVVRQEGNTSSNRLSAHPNDFVFPKAAILRRVLSQ
jgi:predicted double-glycine peptidase